MKRPSLQIGLGIALGAGLGIAAAVIIGSGVMWLAVGVAVGVALGIAMSRKSPQSQKANDNDRRLNEHQLKQRLNQRSSPWHY
jgi:uncharacterized protein YneF (UPF0154 family)